MTTRAGRRSTRSKASGPVAAPAGANAKATPFDTRRTTLLIAGLIVLGVVLWAVTFARQAVPLAGIDAEDYGEIGRQLAYGRGFTALFVPLNGLAWLVEHGYSMPPWPNITRFPLPPLVMAAIFKLFGPSDLAVSGYSLLGYLAGVPFVVLLAKRIAGFKLAVAAGVLYVSHPDALQISVSGLTEPLSATALLAAAWLGQRAGVRSHLVAGLVFGVAFWNRNTHLVLAVPVAFLIWRVAARPKTSVIAFAAGAALLALPWLVWMWVLTGNPLFNLQTATVVPFGTDGANVDFPWYRFAYDLAPPAGFGALVAKWFKQVVGLYDLLPDTLGPVYLLVLAVFGWFKCPAEAKPLRWLVLAWLLVQIAVYSVAGNISRFYTIFLPFSELFGLIGLFLLVRRRLGETRVLPAAALLILLVFLPSAGVISGVRPFEGSPTRDDPLSGIVDLSLDNGPYVATRTKSTDLVLSNLPWSVAWRAERPSVPLPPSPGDLDDFERRSGLRVAALYLTPQMYIVGVPAGWREWNLMRDRGQAPLGFRVDRRFRDGSVLLLRNE